MQMIDAEQVNRSLNFPTLIEALATGFAQNFGMPRRQVYALSPDPDCHDGFAVLPAWNQEVVGVKAFTYFPENSAHHLPTLFSKILLFSRAHGQPLAMIDGTSVTYWRTAAVSALAARYLARPESITLLLLGTGNLAKPLIAAHVHEHAIMHIWVWGRNEAKAQSLIAELALLYPEISFLFAKELNACVQQADIIVSATGSAAPLVLGEYVRPGTHIDLLGNHSQDRRECDTLCVERSTVFVDYRENVLNEAGELLIPIAEGRFQAEAIRADLSQLCNDASVRRSHRDEITLFKSVGTALSDLIAAHVVYKENMQENKIEERLMPTSNKGEN